MKLHPDVVKDLLALELAGEASPASRALIEEHAAADPELARLIAEARDEKSPWSRAADRIAVPPTAEKAALDATRRSLRARSYLLGGAIFASLLPFSIYADDAGIQFLLIRDAPLAAALCFAAAGVLWVAFVRVSRRLRVTGL